jgi:hypothetical protein
MMVIVLLRWEKADIQGIPSLVKPAFLTILASKENGPFLY